MMLFPQYAEHVVMVYSDDEFEELIEEFTPRGFFAVKASEDAHFSLLDGSPCAILDTKGEIAGRFDDIDEAADAIDPLLPL
ncbi:hypothetical protein [Corynebacterium glucuronolyticum]|uniref:hypothetical protein n=1 Tax=Corynebacterium glucuronolyticum TaxID=39791 RepID=UPI00019C20E8|nr:hypothetical protein [Corynebacterium glucuronolyticum]EEI25925.1 hypothetical protein HMPREF0294_2585 [Corynebacterium glucuronolyticum ATCC 51867]QRO82580.1 hypothetical protein I6J20_12260 [Corynebacterium glucuronolyticum]